ncbi:MAG: hypothetical protein ABIR98_12795 [Usitatibacter sp.]
MSEQKFGELLTKEQLQAIAGGDCTVNDLISALEQFKESYETLIDFTSYVIERVAGQ